MDNLEKRRISVAGVGCITICAVIGFAAKWYNAVASDLDREKLPRLEKAIHAR